MADMRTFEDVQAWVEEHSQEGSGVDMLKKAIGAGLISGRSAAIARAWLDEHVNGAQRRVDAERLDLERRATAAAEASAEAAQRSASEAEKASDYAARSARWSMWSVLVAVAALLLSAISLLK